MMKKLFALALTTALFFAACKEKTNPDVAEKAAENPALFHLSTVHLTDVIVHDIFKPPVASRIYTYSFLAAYETLRQGHADYKTMAGVINQFTAVPQPETGVTYCYPLAAVTAFNKVGETLTFSKEMWATFPDSVKAEYKKMGIPEDEFQRSVAYGEKVAAHVLKYADSDMYKETRSGEKYTIKNEPGRWIPTPPTYASACEPQWNKTRFFTMDSASQFQPAPCAKYDMDKNSEYYKLLLSVYDINKNLTDEQKAIAYFWDDNAFVTNISGHLMFATKKMTPPGHWIAIARTVLTNKGADLMKSVQVYAVEALALHDGFIAAWDEKYKSNRIRPVTVIRQFVDPEWMPFLETPSFPEYVSAHSTISAAAGTVLTKMIGDNVAFTDSTEFIYGHGVRSFKSFRQAYTETTDSRVYGGIHYRDGVDAGLKQGEAIGTHVLQKLKLN